NIIYVVVFLLITGAIYWYLNYSKHGYELSVVGESENTARYIGINVKAVTLRTLIMSGALCGLVGFFLSAGVNGMMSSSMDGNMGFTGIMVAWLSHFEPLVMTVVAFFITFITKGMKTVNEAFGFTDEALSSVIIGIIYFLLIASEFLVSYKVLWRHDAQKVVDKISAPFKWFFDKVEWLFKKIGSGFVWLFKKIASLFKKKAKEEGK
ncbi:MAG: ABC transporter permease, partial [Bacilli bacterium]|nr:ABC transporter permease [Bacilli bacterium]